MVVSRGVAERTRALRWVLAVLLALGAVAAVVSGIAQVCPETAVGERVVQLCRPPRLGDGVTLGFGLVLALLLLPDLAEVNVPGLVQLKSRLAEQDERIAGLEAHLSQLTNAQAVAGGAVVNVVSGLDTGRLAVDRVEAQEASEGLERRGDPFADTRDARDRARYVAAELVVAHLGDLGSGDLAEANLRLYLPADDGRVLRPVLDEPGSRRHADDWPIGHGAVGTAWRDGEIVVARGDEITAGMGSLAPERAARYRDLAVIVALPVFDAGRRPIAVLSASSRDPSHGLDSDETLSDLLAATEVVARVLVDLLGWSSDGAAAAAWTPVGTAAGGVVPYPPPATVPLATAAVVPLVTAAVAPPVSGAEARRGPSAAGAPGGPSAAGSAGASRAEDR